jgi:hypothetical protein
MCAPESIYAGYVYALASREVPAGFKTNEKQLLLVIEKTE